MADYGPPLGRPKQRQRTARRNSKCDEQSVPTGTAMPSVGAIGECQQGAKKARMPAGVGHSAWEASLCTP
jgi:hypothetical protein